MFPHGQVAHVTSEYRGVKSWRSVEFILRLLERDCLLLTAAAWLMLGQASSQASTRTVSDSRHCYM